jgi:hypothetical protein
MNFAQSKRAYEILSAGFLTSLIAMMSTRLDRILFYILSSGSVILALLMTSTFFEEFVDGVTSNKGRTRERTADNRQ